MAAEQANAARPVAGPPRPPSPDQEPDFLEEPPRDYYCAVSLELLMDPYQTGCCGHHLSGAVVERLKREGKPCPMCNRPNFLAHPDIYMRRKIMELLVRCRHGNGGCAWTGELGNMNAHVRTCPKKPWVCRHCQFSGRREDSEGHTEGCLQVPVPCPNSCNVVTVPRGHLSSHLDRVCPLQPVICPYNHVGCTTRLTRSEIDAHVQNMEQHHMMLTCSANLDLSRQMNERLAQKETQIEELRADVARLERQLGERVQAVEASMAAQTEWMESNQQQGEGGGEGEGGGGGGGEGEEEEPPPVLTEETIKEVVAGELRGMEERVLQAVKGEAQVVCVVVEENHREAVQEMRKQTAALEGKIEEAITQAEQDRKTAEDEAKRLELAVKREREAALEATEKRVEEVVREAEKTVVEQVKNSLKMQEPATEAGRGEEVKGKVQEEFVVVGGDKPAEDVGVGRKIKSRTHSHGGKEEQRDKVSKEMKESSTFQRHHPTKTRTKTTSSRPQSVTFETGASPPPYVAEAAGAIFADLQPHKPWIVEDADQSPSSTVIPSSTSLHELKPYYGPLRNIPPCEFSIRNFSQQKEQNKEWRSEPFYSREGYKMCLGVWPNGFRSGHGTHVSVEFYKMKDLNTDRLRWNVKLPVHVRIFNYRTKTWEREHVNGETFTRSKVSGEFETSGYAQSHRLVAHGDLVPYLRDDTFKIQVYKFELKP